MKQALKESDVAAYLIKRVTEAGGIYRKVSWEGRADAPDYIIMLCGTFVFVEMKAPAGKPRPSQLREFAAIDEHGGEIVLVVRTFEDVDTLMSAFEEEGLKVCPQWILPSVIEQLSYRRFLKEKET